jgi:hypothetical protein
LTRDDSVVIAKQRLKKADTPVRAVGFAGAEDIGESSLDSDPPTRPSRELSSGSDSEPPASRLTRDDSVVIAKQRLQKFDHDRTAAATDASDANATPNNRNPPAFGPWTIERLGQTDDDRATEELIEVAGEARSSFDAPTRHSWGSKPAAEAEYGSSPLPNILGRSARYSPPLLAPLWLRRAQGSIRRRG